MKTVQEAAVITLIILLSLSNFSVFQFMILAFDIMLAFKLSQTDVSTSEHRYIYMALSVINVKWNCVIAVVTSCMGQK